MRVRTLFFACVALMAALVGVAAASFLVAQWQSYRNASEARHLSLALTDLLRSTEKLTLSRGPQTAPLLADAPASAEARAAIAPMRQALATALDDTRQAVARADFPGQAAALASLGGLNASLAETYARLDQAYALPKPQRDAAFLHDFVPRMIGYGSALNGIANSLERSAATADAAVGRLAGIARLSWDMRDAAGRRSSVFTSAVGSNRKLTMADVEAQAVLTGELRHAWARLQASALQIEDAPRLATAMQTTQARFFGGTDDFIAGLVTRGLAGSDYGASFDTVWHRLIDAAQSALLVRDAAMTEALARADALRATALLHLLATAGFLVLVAAGLIGIALLFSRRVVDPLLGMTTAITRLAQGDRDVDVPARGRHDEIGEMAGALETLRQNAISAARAEEIHRAEEQGRQARTARIEALTQAFDQASAGVIGALDAASTAVHRDAEASSALATDSSARTASVAAGAEQASVGVDTIASAAAAMNSAINEITARVEACASVAANAVQEVEAANQRIAGLGDAVDRIGTIIRLIQDIATQTNLLALNATIEAARAGDAGKGFAVVAGEVKALATQTAKATEEITAQIAAVASETEAAVQAIHGISATVGQVGAVTAEISAAVTQQRQTTGEIAANAQQAASGTKDVSANVSTVNAAMTQVEAGAHRMIATADVLAARSRDLTDRIAAFLGDVRAA